MSEEIDWPMTLGTLVLAAFLGWVVLAMYRPLPRSTAAPAWARPVAVERDAGGAAAPRLPLARP